MSQPGRGTGQTQRVSEPSCVTRAGDTAGTELPSATSQVTYCSYFPPRLPAGQGDRAHLKGFKGALSRENHVLNKLFLEVNDRSRHTASPHLTAGDSTVSSTHHALLHNNPWGFSTTLFLSPS